MKEQITTAIKHFQ